jgi:AmmeMemoRadiSam system protein A
MSFSELTEADRRELLRIARASIEQGLLGEGPLRPDLTPLSARLRADGASFVTLERNGELRGCIGSLEARQALARDVGEHAYDAAFRDPRFPPLSPSELADLHLSISVLSAPQPIEFKDEADLIDTIRPGVDGLILADDGYRGTFLPSVWESLPDPREFLRHLKRKAGLPEDYWSPTLKLWRYTTEYFDR